MIWQITLEKTKNGYTFFVEGIHADALQEPNNGFNLNFFPTWKDVLEYADENLALPDDMGWCDSFFQIADVKYLPLPNGYQIEAYYDRHDGYGERKIGREEDFFKDMNDFYKALHAGKIYTPFPGSERVSCIPKLVKCN